MTILKTKLNYLILIPILLYSCSSKPHGDVFVSESEPKLEPDYTEVTIPPTIVPLNFMIKEEGSAYYVSFSSVVGKEIEVYSKTGKILIPQKK